MQIPGLNDTHIDESGYGSVTWLFSRTEKIAESIQANLISQAMLIGIGSVYLLRPELRTELQDSLHIGEHLIDIVLPTIALFLFVNLGYLTAYYLRTRRDFLTELPDELKAKAHLPYENTSLAFLLAGLFNPGERAWPPYFHQSAETNLGGLLASLGRAPGVGWQLLTSARASLLILGIFVFAIFIGDTAMAGIFISGRLLSGSPAWIQLLAFFVVMLLVLPFHMQFRMEMGDYVHEAGKAGMLALWVASFLVGFVILVIQPVNFKNSPPKAQSAPSVAALPTSPAGNPLSTHLLPTTHTLARGTDAKHF